MKKITFHINYRTQWGQQMYICGSSENLGAWDFANALEMKHQGGEHWKASVEIPETETTFSYKYVLRDNNTNSEEWEFGKNRNISLESLDNEGNLDIWDFWRTHKMPENVFHTAAFTRAIMNRSSKLNEKQAVLAGGFYVENEQKTEKWEENTLIFRLNAPRIAPNQGVAILGTDESLGNWKTQKMVCMDDTNFPIWEAKVSVENPDKSIYYKYVIYDVKTQKVLQWEKGDDRKVQQYLNVGEPNTIFMQNDESFQYENAWRGGGVAIPVFSLRSENGCGIGEFSDLRLLVDWARKTELKLVQILPVNDTIAHHTWTDSYPYAAISVFALHPMYVNVQAMGTLEDADFMAEFEAKRLELNALAEIDYEEVMKLKSRYFKKIFDQEKENFLRNPDFLQFFTENENWLKPYAAFSHLRDLYGTPDFTQWKLYNQVNDELIDEICDPNDAHFEHLAVHYFIQYHAHTQLLAVAEYARANAVTLKGDLPIGIYRYSVDAWTNPQLYNMNGQAGAPPDDFAVAGQNWGFPTYNWDEMAKDGYAWWKARMQKLSVYFDTFRIDHILGFFRIWQIPYEQVEGLLGVFNPALPFSWDELHNYGIHLEYERLCSPYIRERHLWELFGEATPQIRTDFFVDNYGKYSFKPELNTQRKIADFLLTYKGLEHKIGIEQLQKGLFKLVAEVLFFDAGDGNSFHPRISLQNTKSFQELDEITQQKIERAYYDYFYHRHNEFWREQAMKRLPALVNATDMLICGEDLGMIPASVPGVMKELNMLSLEIQRMPKGSVEFGIPQDAPYLSVVSPSCHDMSTIRGWWEEDRAKTQRYHNNVLHNSGDMPFYCEPWVCEQIVAQHLASPAMWAIFPIQDLVALDGKLRRENPAHEQINVPANPKHYWRYRFHLNFEELLKADGLNERIKGMVQRSGR